MIRINFKNDRLWIWAGKPELKMSKKKMNNFTKFNVKFLGLNFLYLRYRGHKILDKIGGQVYVNAFYRRYVLSDWVLLSEQPKISFRKLKKLEKAGKYKTTNIDLIYHQLIRAFQIENPSEFYDEFFEFYQKVKRQPKILETPFLDNFNNLIDIFVEFSENKIFISDDGEILKNLKLQGKYNRRRIEKILKGTGIEIVNDELILDAENTKENYIKNVFYFLVQIGKILKI